jgi:hypothetical protein
VSHAPSLPGFDVYKRELLLAAADYVNGVYEAWWLANSMFPERVLSERLAVAERAIRELLAEGLIVLIEDEHDLQGSEIPRSETDEALKRWDTWAVGSYGIKVYFTITKAGAAAAQDGPGSTRWAK